MDIFQTLYGVGKDICRPLAKCLCSVISLPDRFTELKNQLTTLSRRRADIEAKIEGVNRQKAPTIECKGWIEDVDKIGKEVKDIEDQHLINKRCLSGCFPDVIARARLGKNVEEMIIRAKDLQEKSKFEAGFVDDLPKAEMLPEKLKELNKQLITLCQRRDDIKADIDRLKTQKAPTNECNGWIADVGKIEEQVKKIEEQMTENVEEEVKKIAWARLCEDVEEMIIRVKDLQVKSEFVAGFVADLPKDEMLPEKFKELKKHLTTLCRRREDIKVAIGRANGQKAPTNECNGWIADVGKIEEEVKKIEEQMIENVEEEVRKTAWARLCEDVEEMIKSVADLQVKSKFEAGFLTDLPLAKVEKIPLPVLIGMESMDITLQDIFEHVKDGGTKMIGIWGMGGIGETTLLKLLNSNMPAEVKSMFEVVIWVTISQDWDITKVQNQVAERLSLDIKEKESDATVARRLSDAVVARRLLRALEGKKYLLLLDDVWKFIDLASVGIPPANQNNGCKVVFTTRELTVCRDMSTDVDIMVQALLEKEAWEMFNSKVGDVANFQDIKPIAQEIVLKCGGLPLALNAVGGALRKVEDVDVWNDFLAKLKSPDKSDIKAMSEKVFKVLKASYDRLVSDDAKMKNPFLYCGLFPEDHDIKKSQLITYWRAEGFLSSNYTMMKAGNEGRTLLHNLTDVSLLEKCKDDDNYVKMHDVIRDLVLYLTSLKGGEESRHVVRAGLSEQETVDIKEWEEATRISFMNAKGYSLPEMPNCPKLLTLLLHCDLYHDYYLQAIPESFFNHMPTLRVLDMSGSDICSLPSSISNLVSLRALLLKRCRYLEALPREINALKKLEVLKITSHNMRDLPGEIWELTSLKCLKLKGTPLIKNAEIMVLIPIPRGKISKLSQLEQFEIADNDFELDEESRGVVAGELSNISTPLSSLAFQFGSVNNLKQFVERSRAWRDGSLTKFLFTVGGLGAINMSLVEYKRGLGYDGQIDEGRGIVSSAVRDVIKRSEVLKLRGIRQVLTKLSDLGVGNISGLKSCFIDDCNALEGLADEDGLQANAFANLKRLQLKRLTNLRSILCGCCEISPPMPLKDNFESLEVLNVDECPMLKQLFSSWGLLLQFIHLEELHVGYCKGLEEMISVDNDEIGNNNNSWTPLPKLQFLSLENLEEFVGFFSEGNNNVLLLRWPSLESLYLRNCPKLKRFPFGAHDDDFKRLSILELKNLPEFAGFGDGDVAYRRRCWPLLEEVRIVKCAKLKMLPFGAHDDLQRLKILELQDLPEFAGFDDGDVSYRRRCWPLLEEVRIVKCPKLKMLPFGAHDDLQRLKILELQDLPEFAGFGDGDVAYGRRCWPLLDEVRIVKCPKLKMLPFGAHDDLQRLKILELKYLPEFAGFGDGDVSYRRCWPSLENVSIVKCPKLKMLPFGAHDDLQILKELTLEELSEFVGFREGDVSHTSCCWPSLQRLTLKNCPKLETFPLAPHNLPKLQHLKLDNLLDLVSLGEKKRNDTNTSFTTMSWDSLKIVEFSICPKLEIFPFTGDSAPNLGMIFSDEDLKWQDHDTKLRFSPLMRRPDLANLFLSLNLATGSELRRRIKLVY